MESKSLVSQLVRICVCILVGWSSTGVFGNTWTFCNMGNTTANSGTYGVYLWLNGNYQGVSGATIAPGQCTTVTPPNFSVWSDCGTCGGGYWAGGGGGNYHGHLNNTEDVTIYVYPGFSGPRTNYCSAANVINLHPTTTFYNYLSNGVVTVSQVGIPPGGTASYSVCTYDGPVHVSIQELNSDMGVTGTFEGTDSTVSPPDAPLQASNVGQSGFWTTNIFLGGDSTNISGQLAVLYKEIANLGSGLERDINGLAIMMSNQVQKSGNVTVTNNFTAYVTNNFNPTLTNNLSLFVTNFNSFTNMSGGGGTNNLDWPTGTVASGSSDVFSRLAGSATNGEAATTSAMGVSGMSGIDGNWAAGTSYVGSASANLAGGGLVGAGDASVFSFAFCGTTLDLDPESRFPGFMALVKAAWTFIVLLWFGKWAAEWVLGMVKSYATVELGGVPDLEGELAGFGGNVAGLVVALAVPFAFVLLFVALFTFVSGSILSALGMMPDAASAVGLGGNTGALYLLNASFPVSLAVGLALARISLPLTGSKLMFVGASASRWLFGK